MALQLIGSTRGNTDDGRMLWRGQNSAFFTCETLGSFAISSGNFCNSISTCQYDAALSGIVQVVEEGEIRLEEIKVDGRMFHLRIPLKATRSRCDGGWAYESEPLSIFAFGRSEQEAFKSFAQDFSAMWDEIAQADDASLTGDAIDVMHAMAELVQSVE